MRIKYFYPKAIWSDLVVKDSDSLYKILNSNLITINILKKKNLI